MKGVGLHIVTALVVILCIASCGKRGKVISRSEMEDLYVDLFLADQWLLANPDQARVADTTMFYEPVFRSHGCTTEDYIESVNHYIHDPKRYARILKRADARITAMAAKANAEVEEMETVKGLMRAAAAFHPDLKLYYDTLYMRITKEAGLRFEMDSLGRFLPFVPEPEPLDSAVLDSLARLDSLKVLDSLAALDSIARLDSIVAPIAEIVHGMVPDSLPKPLRDIPKVK